MSFDMLAPRSLCLSFVIIVCSSQSLFAQFGWTFGEPTPLPVPINDEYGNADPTISDDGLTLIWASTRRKPGEPHRGPKRHNGLQASLVRRQPVHPVPSGCRHPKS